MSFKAKITDVIALRGQEGRLCLMINHMEGEPHEGDSVIIGERRGKVVGLADNGIRDRSCLTGKKSQDRQGSSLIWEAQTKRDFLKASSSGGHSNVL